MDDKRELDLGLDKSMDRASDDVAKTMLCRGGCGRTHAQALAEFGDVWHGFEIIGGKSCLGPRWHCDACEPRMEQERISAELQRQAREAVH